MRELQLRGDEFISSAGKSGSAAEAFARIGFTVDDLKVGMPMELVADVLNEDDEHTYVMWKWRPAASAGADQTGAQ